MSLNDLLDKAFGVKKPKIVDIAIERLRPPAKVEKSVGVLNQIKPRSSGDGGSIADSIASAMDNLDPEYKKWCLSLETQRHYYYTKFGKTHRKDQRAVKRDLKNRGNEIKMIELMKTNKRSLYADCMREMKEVLKKRNESDGS